MEEEKLFLVMVLYWLLDYIVSMIGVGYYARVKRKGDTMADFYLAGRSLGMAVLFLTLYATQYSEILYLVIRANLSYRLRMDRFCLLCSQLLWVTCCLRHA